MSEKDDPLPSPCAAIYERAKKVLPGGVSRNAVFRRPHPTYTLRGEGCFVTDIEGNKRIDFANNMASLIHGHAHPAVTAAVCEQVRRGTAFNNATEVEVLFAEHMCARSPNFERIRFVNSGTEAVMCCLKAARAFTRRPKIAKVEGAYHGLYDYAEVSQTAKPDNWGDPSRPRSVPVATGTPEKALDDVVVIPFNDPELAVAILDEHADTLACVLIDPLPHRVCMSPATPEFIAAMREWTTRHGALLAFDEVITFRTEYGGTQQMLDAKPDLTALGKIIGGGFPVGAITGRADVMDVLNPLAEKVLFPHSGTFSANPVTMTAGLTAMEHYDRAAVARLNALGDHARERVMEVIREADFPACVTGAGSMFRIHMKPDPPRNYRESFIGPVEQPLVTALLDHLFRNGVMMINTCSATLSTPMTEREIDMLAERLLDGFRLIRPMLPKTAALAAHT